MNPKSKLVEQNAIIFDCDGVLVDSEIIYNVIERKHLARIGLTYTDREFQERFVGLTHADYMYELSTDYKSKYNKEFPAEYETVVAQETSVAFESELIAIDGAADFIGTLTVPSAVASSSELHSLNRKLEITGLKQFFGPNIYSGEQAPKGKPSPDLFLFTAKQLGVEPKQCIVIEDSVNGVMGGINANMEVWGFTGGGHTNQETSDRLYDAGASYVFSSFASIGKHMHLP